MKRAFKKVVAMLLCLSMFVSVLPLAASAAEDYSGELLQNAGFETIGSYTP